MKRILGSKNFPKQAPNPVVAIGVFDGVHLGHRQIISRARDEAARGGGVSVVYTFEPHPVKTLSPAECPPLIQTLKQKLKSFEEIGVDLCVIEPFTMELAHRNPTDFFHTVIAEKLHAHAVVVGYDFTFGLHRKGNVEKLEELGKDSGIKVTVVAAQFLGETLISSTNIRRLIEHGRVGEATLLLGRPYTIEGRVVAGRGIGRTLHAHTANLVPENELIPKDGVYLTRTVILDPFDSAQAPPFRAGKKAPLRVNPEHAPAFRPESRRVDDNDTGGGECLSVTNVGNNPTFPGSPFAVETHLIDMNAHLLGKRLAVKFLERMRDEIVFDSVEKLSEQIAKDIEEARALHQARSRRQEA